MLNLLATIFMDPITFDGHRLWMLLPLTLVIAVVYKATRLNDIRSLPIAALLLWITILGGMLGVAVFLYVVMAVFLR